VQAKPRSQRKYERAETDALDLATYKDLPAYHPQPACSAIGHQEPSKTQIGEPVRMDPFADSLASLGTSGLLASFAYIRHEPQETGPLDRRADRPLEGRAGSTALPAEEFALAGAELLQALHVLVVNEHRAGAAFFGAKATTVFAAAAELFPNHEFLRPQRWVR